MRNKSKTQGRGKIKIKRKATQINDVRQNGQQSEMKATAMDRSNHLKCVSGTFKFTKAILY